MVMVFKINHIAIILILLSFSITAKGQKAYFNMVKANHLLKDSMYNDAEIMYKKVIAENDSIPSAYFNLGNAKYAQADYESAIDYFQQALPLFRKKIDKAHAHHNIGNAYLEQQQYEESIEAYKEALKLNPNDYDTKYNLAYAQLKLQKEQESQQDQQNQENEQQEDEQEQNQDQENEQNKEEDGQDEENQEKGDQNEEIEEENGEDEQNKKEDEAEKEQGQQPKEGQLTKEQAEQLLKILENEEGKLQEELDQIEEEGIGSSNGKDW